MKFKLIGSLFFILCTTSCLYRDPNDRNEVAVSPETRWTGPPVRALPDPPVPLPEDHPMTPVELIDIALRNNPATTETWATARAAAYDWLSSQGTLYPSIDFEEVISHTDESSPFSAVSASNAIPINPTGLNAGNGGALENQPSKFSNLPIFPNHFNEYSSLLTINYLLLDFGGRDAGIDAAKHALYAANWTHNRSLQDVTINVLNAYYAYVNARELLQAAEENLQNAKANLDAANGQFEEGVTTRVDVLLSRSNYVNVQLSIEQLKGQVEVTHGQMAAALGVAPNTPFQVVMLPEKLPLEKVTDSLDQLLVTAKTLRPDLLATYANFRQTQANLGVAKSVALPTVNAAVNLSRSSYPTAPCANNFQYSSSIVIDVPIFNGFTNVNQIRSAKEQVIASYAQMEGMEQDVLLQVVTNYYAYVTAVETLRYSEEYLHYTNESYKAMFEGYNSGTQTILDTLVSFVALANARAAYANARAQWAASIANLSYSTGTL